MGYPTLKESWKKQGNRVHTMDTNSGWMIFIHVQNSDNPTCGYMAKWSHVVCKDALAHKAFWLFHDNAVPMSFTAETRARDWWRKNEKRIIDAIHADERGDDMGFDFDRYKVLFAKADIEINIDTLEKK